jgi:hypothetical protein
MSQDPKQPQRPDGGLKSDGDPGRKGGTPVDPADDAQPQEAPEKLHGDPLRHPGGLPQGK